jgi:hypothetical protein
MKTNNWLWTREQGSIPNTRVSNFSFHQNAHNVFYPKAANFIE